MDREETARGDEQEEEEAQVLVRTGAKAKNPSREMIIIRGRAMQCKAKCFLIFVGR